MLRRFTVSHQMIGCRETCSAAVAKRREAMTTRWR